MAQFGDWQTWCDNLNRCTAAVETSQSGLVIVRDGDPVARPIASLHLDAYGSQRTLEALHLSTDTKAIPKVGTLVGYGPMYWTSTLSDQQSASLIAGVVNAASLHIRTEHGGTYTVSLRGLAAALRWIDDQQGRVGTDSALVARGKRSIDRPPSSNATTEVTQVQPDVLNAFAPPKKTSAFVSSGDRQFFSDCDPEAVTNEIRLKVEPLPTQSPAGRLLWLKPCRDRAFDQDPWRSKEFRVILTDDMGLGAQEISLPYPTSMRNFSSDISTNVALSFNKKTLRIRSVKRYVGLRPSGNMGSRVEFDTWQWNGEKFVPIEIGFVDECGYEERDCRNRWVSTVLYRVEARSHAQTR